MGIPSLLRYKLALVAAGGMSVLASSDSGRGGNQKRNEWAVRKKKPKLRLRYAVAPARSTHFAVPFPAGVPPRRLPPAFF
jgi:hypothetical protein